MYGHFKWIHKFMSFGRVEIHMIYLEGQKKYMASNNNNTNSIWHHLVGKI